MVSLLLFHDELVDGSSLSGRNDPLDEAINLILVINNFLNLFVSNCSISNVVGNCVVKENAVLWHDGDV